MQRDNDETINDPDSDILTFTNDHIAAAFGKSPEVEPDIVRDAGIIMALSVIERLLSICPGCGSECELLAAPGEDTYIMSHVFFGLIYVLAEDIDNYEIDSIEEKFDLDSIWCLTIASILGIEPRLITKYCYECIKTIIEEFSIYYPEEGAA